MSFQLLPPSPNWYSSRLSSIAQDLDLFIYASRNVLFVLDTIGLQYVHSFIGHKDRINAVSAQGSVCASASADRTVKCWDLVAKVLLEGHELHRNEVQSLTWLVDKSILVSGDKSGQIIVWDSATKKHHRSTILSSAVYCLAATISSGKDIVAIGYQNGSIVVAEVSLDMGATVLYRLEAHEDEIHGLAWQPWFSVQDGTKDMTISDKESTSQFSLLASGSRDKTIRIWDVASEIAIKTLALPKTKNFWTEQQKSRLWLTVAWSVTNRNQLISSSYMGDMLLWNTRDAKAEKFSDGHSRCIFNICVTDNDSKIITISMDRQIIMWDLRARKPSLTVGTLGGFVHSLDVCDLDPRRIAIGLGDNTIRIWNYGGNADNFYDSMVLWKGIKGKVTCLKWHPSQEGVLVYGTDTGSIGLFDVHADKNTAFKSYHKGKVYSIDWGVRVSAGAELQERVAWAVYSCGGEGVVYASDPENPTKASVDVREAIERRNPVWVKILKEKSSKLTKRSEVAVHLRGEYVAIGSADGSIEVHTLPEYKLVYWFNGHRGCINRLRWCGGGDGTPSSLWLASGSEDGLVCVHDLGNAENFVSIELPIPTSTCFRSLKAHNKGITDLGWKISDSGVRLASTSYDDTAVVWDVSQGVPVARFRGHQGHVLSVVWSLLEDDLVFTGGDDSMLCVWRVGEWPYVKITDSGKTTKTQAQAKKPVEPPLEAISGESVGDNLMATEPNHRASLGLPTPVASLLSAPTTSSAMAKKSQQRSSKKIKSNLFPLSTASFLTEPRRNLQKQCLELAARFYGGDATMVLEEMERAVEERKEKMGKEEASKGDNEGDGKGKEDGEGDGEGGRNDKGIITERADENVTTVGDLIFGDKVEVRKLIGMEVENHSAMASSAATMNLAYSFALPLDVWRSNLSGVIAQAMKSNNVDLQEWITLALSPSAGRDAWFNLMRHQAEKLAASGDYHTSAMCFLAISEVYDAVEVYRKAEMYREAITLVKLRLPPDDPILAELYTEWAMQCESRGLFEQAAKCYLSAQTPTSIQHALNVLARRNDPSALYAAACLAKFLKDPSADERMARYEGEMKKRREWEEAMNEHINALAVGSGDELRTETVAQTQEVLESKVTSEKESESKVGDGSENDVTGITVHMDSDVGRGSKAIMQGDSGDVEAVTENVVVRVAAVESAPIPGNDTMLRCNDLNDIDQ